MHPEWTATGWYQPICFNDNVKIAQYSLCAVRRLRLWNRHFSHSDVEWKFILRYTVFVFVFIFGLLKMRNEDVTMHRAKIAINVDRIERYPIGFLMAKGYILKISRSVVKRQQCCSACMRACDCKWNWWHSGIYFLVCVCRWWLDTVRCQT